MSSSTRWDIFCAVIDNYGDIGVCWRLARQLATEHGLQVRLWVDDLPSLHRMCPQADPEADAQTCRGVEIRRWSTPFPNVEPAEVVIEAFACHLPESYVDAMARLDRKPAWINLEYLSAEHWVEGCHGLISPHPPLTKHFFFPGFTPAIGGLLREHDLLLRRDAIQDQDLTECWQSLGLQPSTTATTTVSLFSYDTAPIADLLAAWAAAATPVRCLLPEGKALDAVAAHFDCQHLAPGASLRRGSLSVEVLPFLPQEDYDRLLWICDCNFVRGEDSFVRAQWAAKPMVWNIYPQQEEAHRAKLNAFLDRYCAGLAEDAASALRAFYHGWNDFGRLDWDDFWQHRAALQAHAKLWANHLAADADLASKLVIFCKNLV